MVHGQQVDEPDGAEFVSDERIIKLRSTARDAELSGALRRGGLNLRRVIATREKNDAGLRLAQT